MMGPWAISGALLLGARLVIYEGAPDWPDARPAVVARGAPSDHPPRGQPDARPGAPRPRRGARPRPRSLEPAGPRLDRRAVEPGSVAVVLRRSSAAGGCRSSTTPAGPRSPAGSSAARSSGRSARRRSTGRASGWRADVVDAHGGRAARRGRRARDPDAVAGDDPRLLGRARRRALPRDVLAPDPGPVDPRRLGRRSTPTATGTSTAARDDTLKVAGKRVGPAEVEACAVAHPAVVEAAAIGIPDELKGEAIVVLCVPRPGTAWDPAIGARGLGARRPRSRQARPADGRRRRRRTCPGRGAARSCVASPGPPGSASTRATCRRSRTRRPSRRSLGGGPRSSPLQTRVRGTRLRSVGEPATPAAPQ